MIDLPAEVWGEIFALAADEDVLFQYTLPTVMAEYAWYEDEDGEEDDEDSPEWALRSPQEALNLIQHRSYATKKAIILTCKLFHKLGSELFFRCLFFKTSTRLQHLCSILDASSSKATTLTSSIGWWTRRIHLAASPSLPPRPAYTRAHTPTAAPVITQQIENALVSVIHHCPNLEIFISEWSMSTSFGPIADALTTYARRSLQTIHWSIPCTALPKVIWALHYLPRLVSVTLDFYEPASDVDDGVVNLGAAGDLQLDLPNLQQLALHSHFQDFLEQATGWNLPSLCSFAVERNRGMRGGTDQNMPDIVGFLTQHGLQLRFLDLNIHSQLPLDVPKILDLCPVLWTFAFNADWIIRSTQPPSTNPTVTTNTPLVNHPHTHIRVIGLHGLTHAFGVSSSIRNTQPRTTHDPIASFIACSWNDTNFSACNHTNFPKLQRIRVLSAEVLEDLNRENGPTKEDGGFDRWEKWWNWCQRMNVRLEDCTGDLLGTLPEPEGGSDDDGDDDDGYGYGSDDGDEEYSSGDEEDEDEESEGDSEYETGEEDLDGADGPGGPDRHASVKEERPPKTKPKTKTKTKSKRAIPGWNYTAFSREQSPHVNELRQLLEECRAMAQERDESMIQGVGSLSLGGV